LFARTEKQFIVLYIPLLLQISWKLGTKNALLILWEVGI